LVKVEAEIAEHERQWQQLMLQWQQRAVSKFEDHEQRLAASCAQVQHLQKVCNVTLASLSTLTGEDVFVAQSRASLAG